MPAVVLNSANTTNKTSIIQPHYTGGVQVADNEREQRDEGEQSWKAQALLKKRPSSVEMSIYINPSFFRYLINVL